MILKISPLIRKMIDAFNKKSRFVQISLFNKMYSYNGTLNI